MEEMNPQEISEKAVPQQDDATLETPVDITAEDTTEKPVETPVEETVEAPVEAETPAVVPEETSAEPVVAELPDEETAEEPSKESLLNRLKVIAEEVQEISKQELDSLKQTFYKLRNAELDVERKAYLEHGGTEETFMPVADAIEQEFKRVMAIVREKRSKAVAELDKLREENLIKKMAIIDRLKELLESSEDAGKFYSDFKQLQNQWNEIKQVPQAKAKEVWKQYQHYVEKFYDILKLNNEFRDYDFKKNLEIKQRLCEAAEKLAASDDVVSAFHHLQKLHQEYRDTGPVARSQREELWSRFKMASSVISKRHHRYVQEQKDTEALNYDQKVIICEIVESIEYDQLSTFGAWNDKMQEVIALQNKWKTIGYAPKRQNGKVFERFRKACDAFFKRKAEYYKGLKADMSVGIEKRKALCEQAEAMKESTDWKETTEAYIRLQKEWKALAPIQKRQMNALWKRFITACDYFFERKNKEQQTSGKDGEYENLSRKKAIIEQLQSIDQTMSEDELATQVRSLMNEWNEIGHVPYREKERLIKQYRALIDNLFETHDLNLSKKRLMTTKPVVGEKVGGTRERDRLLRNLETLKSELQTYENNMGFLSASSKSGNTLMQDVQRKMEKLKTDISEAQTKLKALDEEARREEEAPAEPKE